MAAIYGILGQSAPAATTLTTAYTVPSAKHVTARVIVCNRGGGTEAFRVAVSPNGAAIANAHYIAFDQVSAANDTVASVPFTAGDGDIVRVYSAGGNHSFSVTGIEEDD